MAEMWISVPGIAYNEKKGCRIVIPSLSIEVTCEAQKDTQKTLKDAVNSLLGEEITTPEVSWYQPVLRTQIEPNSSHFIASFREWDRLINYILEKEPLIETKDKAKKAKQSSHLTDVSPQDVIDFGYDYDWLADK